MGSGWKQPNPCFLNNHQEVTVSNMTPILIEEHVPMKSRLAISLSDSAVAILQTVVSGGALTYYFTRVRGLEADLAGIVWLLFGIWNAINDPLFGFISDRTKSGLGRRKPYIRYGAPLIALAFGLLWANLGNSQTIMFVQLLIGLFLYDTLYTAIATSIYVLPFEVAVSNKARSTILIWKIIFMVFPNVLPFAIAYFQPGPADDPTPYRLIMAGLAILMGVIIYFSTYFYEEKHFQQQEQQLPFLKSIKESFSNFAFVIFLVLSFSVMYIQTALLQGVAYYFDEIMATPLPVIVGLAAGIPAGIVLWLNRRDRWGIKRCLVTWLGLFAAGCGTLFIFGKTIPGAIVGFFLVGIGFAGGMYLIPIMNGDVIDYDEERTGLRREGMYAGINSLVTKPAISLAQWAFLSIIAYNGYDQTLAKGLQSAQAETGILIAWALIPAGLLILSLIATRWYPLAGEKWETIKKKLTAVHAEKETQFLESLGYSHSK